MKRIFIILVASLLCLSSCTACSYNQNKEENNEQETSVIEIPDELTNNYEYEDEISDYITDVTGFCHFGFDIVD